MAGKRKPMFRVKADRIISDPESRIKAYMSVTVADSVSIHGVRVMQKKDGGLFAAMPSRSYTDGSGNTKYAEIANPISAGAREALNEAVLLAYDEEIHKLSDDEDFSEIDDEDLPFDISM